MIAISMPNSAKPGTTFCASVTGATGRVDVRVIVDGHSVPAVVTETASGTTVKFKIPRGAKEYVQVYVVDGAGQDAEDNALIG